MKHFFLSGWIVKTIIWKCQICHLFIRCGHCAWQAGSILKASDPTSSKRFSHESTTTEWHWVWPSKKQIMNSKGELREICELHYDWMKAKWGPVRIGLERRPPSKQRACEVNLRLEYVHYLAVDTDGQEIFLVKWKDRKMSNLFALDKYIRRRLRLVPSFRFPLLCPSSRSKEELRQRLKNHDVRLRWSR